MIVTRVQFSTADGVSTFEAFAATESEPPREFKVAVRIHKAIAAPETPGDAFLAAFLVPAMYLGETLTIRDSVSLRLSRSIPVIQELYHGWFPGLLNPIQVKTPSLVAPSPSVRNRNTACFFSGGVDSWYSLLKNQDEIGSLVTVQGFDLPFGDSVLWPELLGINRKIAAELGKELLPVETDVRDFLDPTFAPLAKPFMGDFWGPCLHGACLGAISLCFQRSHDRFIVAGSLSHDEMIPWGSHPLLDPLWSSEQTQLVHDGCEATRMQKLARVAQSDLALRHLRVCSNYQPGRYNCCECEKCIRTMIGLRLLGALERAPAFDKPLNLARLRRELTVPLNRELPRATPVEPFHRELLAEALKRGDREVAEVIQIALNERRCLSRECNRWLTSARRLSLAVVEALGLKRHARSIRKRWPRVRQAVAPKGAARQSRLGKANPTRA